MPQNAKYTCARATHLVLSAKSFLQSFRRFARRRDLPSALLSDNARTFKPSKRMVRHLFAIEVEAESIDNQVPGHSSIPLQGSQPVVNSNPPKEQPHWNAAVRGEILRKFWLWDYLRWGVSKVGSVRIVWLTFLTCSWAFCYSFYGVMKIYHVTSFTCTCLACLRVRIWWIVCENWRVKWCRFVADMYRFQGLKRWNYNKRVAVSYKDDLSDWTVANYKFRNSRPVTEKLEES